MVEEAAGYIKSAVLLEFIMKKYYFYMQTEQSYNSIFIKKFFG